MNCTFPRIGARAGLPLVLALALPLGCDTEPLDEEDEEWELQAEDELEAELIDLERGALVAEPISLTELALPSDPLRASLLLTETTLIDLDEADSQPVVLEMCLLLEDKLWCWEPGEDEPLEFELIEVNGCLLVGAPAQMPGLSEQGPTYEICNLAVPTTSGGTKPQKPVIDQFEAREVNREEPPAGSDDPTATGP